MSVEPGRPVDSVQIATLLQDTVIDVADVDPTPRRRGGVAILAAAAALSLLAAITAFTRGVSAATENQAAQAQWVADGRDALDFAPARLSWGWDLVALLGGATGLVCAALAVSAFRGRPRRTFAAGGQTLVVATGDGEAFFRRAPGMTVELDGVAQTTDVVPLAKGTRLRAQSGQATFLVTRSMIRAGGLTAASGDRRLIPFALGSALAHALVVGLFALVADDMAGYSSEELGSDFLDTHIAVKAGEPPREEPIKEHGKDGSDGPKQGAAAEIGKSGKQGTEKSTRETGKAAIKKTHETEQVALKRPGDVRSAGALGVFRTNKAFSAITGQAAETSGLDDRDVFGGWRGQEIADQSGGFGSGLDGDGPGGGGRNLNTIGGNRYLMGPLGPTGGGYKPGLGDPTRRPRPPGDIVVFGTAQVKPGIDKNTLRRYVRQKMPQIAHCYERELMVHPTLTGTVTARWTIDNGGRVLGPSAKGMEKVDSCVAGVISTIQFPAGEMIEVTAYPFIFKPVGI